MRPIDKLLPLLSGVVQVNANEYKALCTCHADTTPSLTITIEPDGKLLLHCFVCGPGVKAAAFCMAVGLLQSDLYPESLDRLHRPKTKAGQKRPRDAKRVAEYLYRDEQGIVKFRAVRFEWPVEGKAKPEKDFEQHQPDGQGGWIFNIKGAERVLYCLPELLAADKSQIVYLVEGEKKVDLLRSWGLTATCNVGGAKGKWLKGYTTALAGRPVVILPDNDPVNETSGERPGHDWAVRILKNLSVADGAASVRIVELPGLPPKGDIVDWAAAGHTATELLALAGNATPDATAAITAAAAALMATAPARDPNSVVMEEQILRDIQLDVLGEIEGTDGKIKVFSEAMRKSHVIRDIGKLSHERLLQVCGPIVKAKVNKGMEDIDGMHRMSDVRSAIATMSSFRRIDDETEVGMGCWPGLSDDLRATDSIILVGAGEAAKWNGTQKLEKVTKPRIGGILLDIGSSVPWYEYQKLSELLQKAGDNEWAFQAAMEAEVLFSRWRWKSDRVPSLIVGLILATWIQTIWAWRPLVSIIGQSNSGKTFLFDAIVGIFGKLAVKSSGSSAAGIRQFIKRSASVIMIDENEASKKRDEIMEMIRASSRGDRVLRGSAGHKGHEFTLRHIVWMGAIESGLKREADKNRFITLECLLPTEEMAGKLEVPPEYELKELGMRLLAVAIRFGLQAKELAIKLKSQRFAGVHPRIVESFAVPAAMHASIRGISDDATLRDIMTDLLKSIEIEESVKGDQETLIEDISNSIIDTGHGTRATVYQAIEWRDSGTVGLSCTEALERSGIAVFMDEAVDLPNNMVSKGDFVFIVHTSVSRHLLKGTTWDRQSIDQILCRIGGAVRSRRRLSGRRHYGIMVPLSQFIHKPTETLAGTT